jgi:hypothetical protein
MSVRRPRIPAALLRLAPLGAALLAAGCGFGPGKAASGLRLTVTRDFGAQQLRQARRPHAGGAETVMRFLERNARVSTRYGGGFVQSIDGLGGGSRVDWFYYVNGAEAERGAAATSLHAGDSVWWDRHDWSVAQSVPAVVGSFPEPFLHGIGGRRFPVRVECAPGAQKACDVVARRLAGYGIPAAEGSLRTSVTEDTLRVLVGPWAAVSEDPALARIQDGPATSGVYARPAAGGSTLALLDPRGRTTRTLGAGGGLIAATRVQGDPPIWTVSGTDAGGVLAAARAFGEPALRDRFAVALAGASVIPLPVDPAR